MTAFPRPLEPSSPELPEGLPEALPATLRVEVKLTTSSGVQVASRELEALVPHAAGEAGLLAVLFWCGDREVDGAWVLVDTQGLPARCGRSVSSSRAALARLARSQPWLDALRRHVDLHWPAFLEAFADEALGDHARLVEELARCHREGLLHGRLPTHDVLAAEHRARMSELLRVHGEADAGRIAQDLLAYLLALAGYRQVTNNAVGVPDLVLTGLGGAAASTVLVELTEAQARRLVHLCQASGDHGLARAIAERWSGA